MAQVTGYQKENKMAKTLEAFRALPLQMVCQAVNKITTREEAAQLMSHTIEKIGKQITSSKRFIGEDCKLVVLPEYFLTSFPMGESISDWAEKAAIDMDGKEYESLGKIAQDNAIYLSGNVYERDPNFPGIYFQTSFIINPSGNVALRYRRLNSMFAVTPHDVWDTYLDVYGADAIFPVIDTEIGKLACVASEEILYPEVARCHALKGAEIFCHSSSEVYGPVATPKRIAKQARAFENMAYVVSANSAGIYGIDIPASSTDGGSMIVNYEGLILNETGPGESMAAFSTIDIAAVRRARKRVGMGNMLARQRLELYADSYASSSFYPVNSLLEKEAERSHFKQMQEDTIERLTKAGILS